MLLTIIIIQVIIGVIAFLIGKRYEMSEKVDRGIELCYWKLSYRRKFIRTLWLIPVDIIVIVEFYKMFQSYTFTGIIVVMLFASIFIQAIYNYRKWKNEIEQ